MNLRETMTSIRLNLAATAAELHLAHCQASSFLGNPTPTPPSLDGTLPEMMATVERTAHSTLQAVGLIRTTVGEFLGTTTGPVQTHQTPTEVIVGSDHTPEPAPETETESPQTIDGPLVPDDTDEAARKWDAAHRDDVLHHRTPDPEFQPTEEPERFPGHYIPTTPRQAEAETSAADREAENTATTERVAAQRIESNPPAYTPDPEFAPVADEMPADEPGEIPTDGPDPAELRKQKRRGKRR